MNSYEWYEDGLETVYVPRIARQRRRRNSLQNQQSPKRIWNRKCAHLSHAARERLFEVDFSLDEDLEPNDPKNHQRMEDFAVLHAPADYPFTNGKPKQEEECLKKRDTIQRLGSGAFASLRLQEFSEVLRLLTCLASDMRHDAVSVLEDNQYFLIEKGVNKQSIDDLLFSLQAFEGAEEANACRVRQWAGLQVPIVRKRVEAIQNKWYSEHIQTEFRRLVQSLLYQQLRYHRRSRRERVVGRRSVNWRRQNREMAILQRDIATRLESSTPLQDACKLLCFGSNSNPLAKKVSTGQLLSKMKAEQRNVIIPSYITNQNLDNTEAANTSTHVITLPCDITGHLRSDDLLDTQNALADLEPDSIVLCKHVNDSGIAEYTMEADYVSQWLHRLECRIKQGESVHMDESIFPKWMLRNTQFNPPKQPYIEIHVADKEA